MTDPKITKSGNALIKKVGHTTGQNHGSNPMVKKRGDTSPTEITYGNNPTPK